jgi:hypothetical protein
MPHTYDFSPPLRGSMGGPLLRIPLPEPSLESALSSRRVPASASPYRTNRDVENLLDRLTMGIRPRTLDDGLLFVSLGLSGKGGGDAAFRPSLTHIHVTDEPMRPDVLLSHSSNEGNGRVVSIAMMEELSLLAASLLRELGYDCYLSTIRTPHGIETSSLSVIHGGELGSFTISGSHPAVARITIFDDLEVVHLLSLLKGFNDLKRLRLDVETRRSCDTSPERFAFLMAELGSGCMSGHHASDLLLRELERLLDDFPWLAPGRVS